MTIHTRSLPLAALQGWLPPAARHYLEHTDFGVPIRELARQSGLHASTVLRQIRRFETRRDDPLVDEALRFLSHSLSAKHPDLEKDPMPSSATSLVATSEKDLAERLNQDCFRVLRRIAEQGAVLAVARDMEKGVVVREGADGSTQRLAVVDREVAQAIAMREWIQCDDPEARIARYRINGTGRAALKEMVAARENRAQGFSESSQPFGHAETVTQKPRHILVDSPLSGLARRRMRDGQPFLNRSLVSAGERLREDYELSRLEGNGPDDWQKYLTEPAEQIEGSASESGPLAARQRVAMALHELGPGLGDVALRVCCFLEGMETLEKRMGWSARSGKIVLRIALQRLSLHYSNQNGGLGPKIG